MELAAALLFGLIIGSILNVCIVRLPCCLSVVRPRSRCSHCRTRIAWYHNIPLLSYLVLRRRCRQCGLPISARYPLVEAVTGLISALLFLKFAWSLEWFVFLAFSASMMVLVFIDLEHRILPDPITLNGIWIGLASSALLASPDAFAVRIVRLLGADLTNPRIVALAGSVMGMAFGGGLLWFVGEAYVLLRGVEGMGFGDVKMMAMVGSFLGLPLTLLTVMLGSLLGSAVGLVLMFFYGKSRQYPLPFGTFLGAAVVVALLYGDDLLRAYGRLMMQPGL